MNKDERAKLIESLDFGLNSYHGRLPSTPQRNKELLEMQPLLRARIMFEVEQMEKEKEMTGKPDD